MTLKEMIKIQDRGKQDKILDDERMESYAYTGDPIHLTPKLTRRMQVSSEDMKNVNGATEKDIADAEIWQKELDVESDQLEQKFLSKYGLDQDNLEKLKEGNAVDYASHLLEVASQGVTTENRDKQDDDRDAISYAKDFILEFVINDDKGVDSLFSAIRYSSPEGIRDIQVLKGLFKDIHHKFIILSNTHDISKKEEDLGSKYADFLNKVADITNDFLEKIEVPENINYLTHSYLYNFCIERKFTESATLDNDELWLADKTVGLERLADLDRDEWIPFKIEKDKLAVFGRDKAVLYLADEEYTKKHAPRIKKLRKQIHYSVAGQYFGRRIVADIPDELSIEVEDLINGGDQLGRDSERTLFKDPKQLRDYLYLLQADMRETVENDFGISLKELSIQEQVYFLAYLQKTSVEKAKVVQDFTKGYGVNGMRTFLALDKLGNDFGDTIVNFGNQQAELSAEYFAEVVFGHFNDLVDSVNGTEQYINEQFSKSVDKETLREVIDGVKVRAAYFLHDLLNQPLGNSSDTWKRIGEALERAKVDAVLFTSTFRILKERDELNLEDIKDTTFETVSSEELAQDRKATERMEAILRKNYESYPPEFRAQILNGMKGAFGRNETRWYLLRHKDEVVGFNRFDERRDTDGNLEELYFGSFNVDSSFGNGKLGEAIFEASFKKEMEHGVPIRANCDPKAPVTQKYISAGFVADSYENISGVPSFSILLDSSTNDKLKTKQLGKEEIIKHTEYDTKTETAEFTVSDDVPDFTRLKSGGWVLTQYFSQGGRYYSVFEKFSS